MLKRCAFCGRFFVPDRRVGPRQKACGREACKKNRKKVAQRAWVDKNPGYFQGRYPYVKEWRQKRKPSPPVGDPDMIQDKSPRDSPLLRLILLIPAKTHGLIQDKIVLHRQSRSTFAASG